MNYILTDNATGTEYVQAFKPGDFHRIVVDTEEAGAAGWEPTREQAHRQISIWNRSQLAHRQEFSYRLA